MVQTTVDAAALGFGGRRPVSTRALKRYIARRQSDPGYPWDGKFTTREQVRDYLSGDRIICLICGKAFRRLSLHVQVHGVDEVAYREKYGLTFTRGLTCDDSFEKYSAYGKARAERDRGRLLNNLKKGRQTKSENPEKHRQFPHYYQTELVDRLKKINPPKKYNTEDGMEFLRRMSEGKTAMEVSKDHDMPNIQWVYLLRKKDKNYDAKFVETVEALPFAVQSKMDSLGPRFNQACRALFDQGISDKCAAEILGVTAMACNKRTKPWREEQRRAALDNSQVI